MKRKILLSGAAGFLGSHLVSYILEKTDWDLVLLDRLDFSGTLNRLAEVIQDKDKSRITYVWHDLKAPINEITSKMIGEIDDVIHLAASSHVDRSLIDPLSFIMDNVVGTTNLLVWAKDVGMKREYNFNEKKHNYFGKFINFSTDESFGPALNGTSHKEDAPHKPSNPYAAAKAGQEDIGYSFYISYNLPVITSHTMNNFGTMQHPEKLVPKTIRSVIKGESVPIFSKLSPTGEIIAAGSRFWLNTVNMANAVLFLLDKGVAGESYNIIGFDELTNLQMAEKIASIIGKPLVYQFKDVYEVRNGHDVRYALDGSKMRDLGWIPEVSFEESLIRTVKWYMDEKNSKWI